MSLFPARLEPPRLFPPRLFPDQSGSAASFTVSPSTISANTGDVQLLLTASAGIWNSGTTFTLLNQGGANISALSSQIIDPSHAILSISTGSGAGSVVITDTTTSASVTVPVLATYQVQGPRAGFVDVATGFLVNLTPQQTLSAPVVVTISDGGAGGVVSPATVTLPAASQGAAVGFSYTPPAIGSFTLTFSNDGGLSDPASITFTAGIRPPRNYQGSPSIEQELAIRSVIDYGADRTGGTDSLKAFQDAIADGPGLVAVLPGLYLLSQNVQWLGARNVTIWQHSGVSFINGALPGPTATNAVRLEPGGAGVTVADSVSTEAFGEAPAPGVAPTASRSDHKHGLPSLAGPSFGSPVAEAFGALGSDGIASMVPRSDHVHAMPANPVAQSGVPVNQALGDVASRGSSSVASPLDHRHGMPAGASPGASNVGDLASTGVATTVALSDHQHAREKFGPPASSSVGDAGATGSASTVAHSDHQHARESFDSPGASAVGDTTASGSSTSPARADHRHARETFATTPSTQSFGDAASGGTATTVTRGDHKHAMPASPKAILLLNFSAAADLATNVTGTAGTWVDITSDQSFTVQTTNDLVEIVARAMLSINPGGSNMSAHLRLYVDGGTIVIPFAGVWAQSTETSAYLSGAITLLRNNLAAGVHTARIQFLNNGAGAPTFSCRPSSAPNTESYAIAVTEFPQ